MKKKIKDAEKAIHDRFEKIHSLAHAGEVVPIEAPEVDVVTTGTPGAPPLLVDVWAEWCGPCRAMKPVMKTIAKDLRGRLWVFSLDCEQGDGEIKWAKRYRVRSLPTLMLFRKGKDPEIIVGQHSAAEVREWLKGFGIA